MILKFNDIYVSQDSRYIVEIEEKSQRYYVSFLMPTMHRQSEYELYYWLPIELQAYVHSQPEKIYSYIMECLQGLHENMLINENP